MRITRHSLAAVIGIVLLAGGLALAQAADPLVGTWKLNTEKSKGTAMKSGTTRVEKDGEGIKMFVDLLRTDGTAYKWTVTGKYDGKDSLVTGTSPYGDAVAMERVDAHTYKFTSKMGGKVTASQTIVIAADGKTRTNTSKGSDAKGQPLDTIAFYDKQ